MYILGYYFLIKIYEFLLELSRLQALSDAIALVKIAVKRNPPSAIHKLPLGEDKGFGCSLDKRLISELVFITKPKKGGRLKGKI